jgi:hypothetical protein
MEKLEQHQDKPVPATLIVWILGALVTLGCLWAVVAESTASVLVIP